MRASAIVHLLLLLLHIFTVGGDLEPSNRGPTKGESDKGEPSKAGSSKGGSSEKKTSQEQPGTSKKGNFKCTKCNECDEEKCMCYGR
jgi:hypothetical protein